MLQKPDASLSDAMNRVAGESPRDGILSVPAKLIQEGEVDTIRDAINHPIERPDPWALAISLCGALAISVKAAASASGASGFSLENGLLFGISLALSVGLVTRFLTLRQKKSPLHDRARKNLDKLFPEQSVVPGSVRQDKRDA
jgi:hypothetical protein